MKPKQLFVAAIGFGDENVYGNMACRYDGIFTFEYLHPHGSTPDFTALSPYTLQETLYTYVDLHKYIFPQDSLVSLEIDGFNLHGSIAQRRRGFMHRSGSDYYNHTHGGNNQSEWNLDEYLFDGFHSSTGYDKYI